jgi:mycofactocin system creatininase family protein
LRLGDLTWVEAEQRGAGWVLAVPLGATEQHGPHLPIDTDTRIACALARRLSETRDDVVVAPPLAYGSSGEHSGFAGTLSIGQEALELVLLELARSADHWDGVVFVSGHGGNAKPLTRAVRRIRDEGREALAWWPSIEGGDAHAGHVETSLLLALDPDAVDMRRAMGAGRGGSLHDMMARLRKSGVKSISPDGVLGNPATATATDGERFLDELMSSLLEAVGRWRP